MRPTREAEKQIGDAYLRGDKVADIADRFKVDERTIRRIRTKLGIPSRLPGKNHEASLRERAARSL